MLNLGSDIMLVTNNLKDQIMKKNGLRIYGKHNLNMLKQLAIHKGLNQLKRNSMNIVFSGDMVFWMWFLKQKRGKNCLVSAFISPTCVDSF